MDNKLSEPSDNITDALNSLKWWKQLAEAAEKRISALLAELEAKDKRIAELSIGKVGNALLERESHHMEVVGQLIHRNAELEVKLATPVRLSGTTHPRCRQQHADDIRAAGFKCVGDEQ